MFECGYVAMAGAGGPGAAMRTHSQAFERLNAAQHSISTQQQHRSRAIAPAAWAMGGCWMLSSQ